MKTQGNSEKTSAAAQKSKQTTFDSLPPAKKNTSQAPDAAPKKGIVITEIGSAAREDDLSVKISFSLSPSKAAFSKVNSELFFDGEKLSSGRFIIPQSKLAKDDFEIPLVLGMKGVAAGSHVIRVEMYELWSSGEKLHAASREVQIDYVPVTRAEKLIKIPIVKQAPEEDVFLVSSADKKIYSGFQKDEKEELTTERDGY